MMVSIFSVLYIALGVFSALAGVTVLLAGRRILAVTRRRYQTVSAQYRKQGREGIPASLMPTTMTSIVALGATMCAFAALTLFIGVTGGRQ